MKHFGFLVFLAFLFCEAYAQSYTPFISADSSDVWKQLKWYSPWPDDAEEIKQVFRIKGDTMIGQHTYATLWINQEYHWWDPTWNDPPAYSLYSEAYVGAIRESNKRIYYIYTDSLTTDSTEYLIYDFNLQVGDTVPNMSDCWFYDPPCFGGPMPSDTVELIIQSIDSMLVGNNYRKRFNLPNDKWIVEGIGSSSGLLNSKTYFLSGDNRLLCYLEQEVPLYSDGGSLSCQLDMSISSNELGEIKVYPNPSNGIFSIELPSSNSMDLKVIDLFGRTLYHSSAVSGKVELEIGHLSAGIYMIQLTDGARMATQRIVIE